MAEIPLVPVANLRLNQEDLNDILALLNTVPIHGKEAATVDIFQQKQLVKMVQAMPVPDNREGRHAAAKGKKKLCVTT